MGNKLEIVSSLAKGRRSFRANSGFLLMIAAICLSGCVTSGDEASLGQMAMIESADFYSIRSVDETSVGLFHRSSNVPAGMHSVVVQADCNYGNCPSRTFRFYAKPGYIYRIQSDDSISVLDTNDHYQRKVDEFRPVNVGGMIEYVNRNDQSEYARKAAMQAQAARLAQIERRKQQLPLVRKIGARICQARGDILYVGFVESFSDAKLQIRVADAVARENHAFHLGDFSPNIVWDDPMNWDLCE